MKTKSMDYLPSRLALQLTKAINYASVILLIVGVTGMGRLLMPKWAGLWLTFGLWGPFIAGSALLVKVSFAFDRHQRLLRKRFSHASSLIPDYAQIQWQVRARQFRLQRGEEWRPVQAFALGFIAFLPMEIYNRVPVGGVFAINLPMACLISSMCWVFSHDPSWGKKRPIPPTDPPGPGNHDPDDYGSAGMGVRVRPPVPTLQAGEEEDRRSYGRFEFTHS